MGIRYATPKDISQVRALWELGFGDEQPYTGWYFDTVYRPERTLLLHDAGELRSALQFAPYKLWLNGAERPVAYLVGVVTHPDHRHRGYGHALLREILQHLREQGFLLAMLYTDVPGFYAPLGFVHCYQLRRIGIKARETGVPEGWEPGEIGSDISRLDAIYRRMTAPWNGYILRREGDWRNFLEELACDQGQIWLNRDTYVLWYIEEGIAKVREIGFTDEASLRSALDMAAILAARCGFDQAEWLAPLNSPPSLGGETIPHVMTCRLDKPELDGGELAQATLELFSDAAHNWVNEKT